MKIVVFVVALLLILLCVICFSHTANPGEEFASAPSSENITVLDDAVWPVNEYTGGLPVLPGKVEQAQIDTEKKECSIILADISDADYISYVDHLTKAGFSVTEDTTTENDNQNYFSVGQALSNGEKKVSVCHESNRISIRIVLEP